MLPGTKWLKVVMGELRRPIQNTKKYIFTMIWILSGIVQSHPPLVWPPEEECLLTSCKHCSFRESFFLQILAFNIQIQFIFQGEIRSGGYALAVQFHKSNIIFQLFLEKLEKNSSSSNSNEIKTTCMASAYLVSLPCFSLLKIRGCSHTYTPHFKKCSLPLPVLRGTVRNAGFAQKLKIHSWPG